MQSVLAERDGRAVAEGIVGLTPRVTALRTSVARIGSSHIVESIADLTALGITAAD